MNKYVNIPADLFYKRIRRIAGLDFKQTDY